MIRLDKSFSLASSVALLAIFIVGCAAPGSLAAPTVVPVATSIPASRAGFLLTSSAFVEGQPIPKVFSCDGSSVSPALSWSGAPSGTKSFALIMDDPDAPAGTFTHWVLYDIPASLAGLAEGAKSIGVDGLNGRRQPGYTGPCPPNGTHRYFFTLYALDVSTLGVNAGAQRADVEKATNGHVIGQAKLMGTYSR